MNLSIMVLTASSAVSILSKVIISVYMILPFSVLVDCSTSAGSSNFSSVAFSPGSPSLISFSCFPSGSILLKTAASASIRLRTYI
jgi:hypothetical protein